MRFLLLAVFFLMMHDVLLCQNLNNVLLAKDTLIQKDPFWRHLISPGVFATLSAASWRADEGVKNARNRYAPNFHNKLDDHMQYAPAATVLSLNALGIKGRNRLGRAILNWGVGMLIMGGLVNTIKYSTRVSRPDGSARNSFPSGHTATAFMNATFLHKEYAHVSPLYSIMGYSMSSYTGISRSLNNRHWLSDILTGASIGILSAELSYLIVNSFYKNKGDFFTAFDVRKELDKPSFVSVKFGQSFYTNGWNSFEKLGLEGAVEGAYFFNKKWGIGAELAFMHMPFEREAVELPERDGLQEYLTNPQMDVQSLGISSLMMGGYYSKTLGPKFILQGKLCAGMGMGVGGKISIRAEMETNKKRVEINSPLMEYHVGSTWIMGGGASLTMMVAPTLGISLYADYKFAYPEVRYSISKYDSDVKDLYPDSEKLAISALTGGLRLVSFF